MKTEVQIDVQDLDHLGIIAGIVDEIGIVEVIDKEIGTDAREKVSARLCCQSNDNQLHGVSDCAIIFV